MHCNCYLFLIWTRQHLSITKNRNFYFYFFIVTISISNTFTFKMEYTKPVVIWVLVKSSEDANCSNNARTCFALHCLLRSKRIIRTEKKWKQSTFYKYLYTYQIILWFITIFSKPLGKIWNITSQTFYIIIIYNPGSNLPFDKTRAREKEIEKEVLGKSFRAFVATQKVLRNIEKQRQNYNILRDTINKTSMQD